MYDSTHGLYVAHGPEGPISIIGKMANRHGLIAGATGTGKTVTRSSPKASPRRACPASWPT